MFRIISEHTPLCYQSIPVKFLDLLLQDRLQYNIFLILYLIHFQQIPNLLRNTRWDKGRVECPCCHSYDINKDGQYRSYHKYIRKQCNRWFNDKTDTVFHYSHTPLKNWFLALYLYFVLWP